MLSDTINQYKILNQLGEGGMGVVYLAEDTRLHRKVALKFISGSSINRAEEQKRFFREAQAAARLNHPSICTVYELGEYEKQTFIALEYVEGQTLKERIEQGPVTNNDVRKWLVQIAEGLLTAHEQGVIHRDIKPANIMITQQGHIKIMDFGIAKLSEVHTELTQANSTIGTIHYMSPEQAMGEGVDLRSDIWSLGVVLYELATGKRPFGGAFREAVVYALMNTEPSVASEINPDIDEDLDRIITRCLKRNREERYDSLHALLADLDGSSEPAISLLENSTPSSSVTNRAAQSPSSSLKDKTLLGLSLRKYAVAGIFALLVTISAFPHVRNALFPSPLSSGLPQSMHLVVLPFDTISEDSEDIAFSNGMAHLVATNLMRMVPDREELLITPVREVLSRGVKSTSEAKKSFGINLAISGTIVNLPGQVQISLDVTDARSLHVIGSEVIDLSALDPVQVQTQVMEKLATLLEISIHPEKEPLLLAQHTKDPEAYKLYIQAQGFIQRYEDIGNVDEAIRLYEKAIKFDSSYALAYAGAGFAYARKYHFSNELTFFNKARERSEKAIELNDQLAEVWVARGRVLLDSGETDEGITALKRALEIDAQNYEANRRLGTAYLRKRDFETAGFYTKQAIALQPNYWDGYNLLGIVYRLDGNIDESIRNYEKAIELSPQNPSPYINLANQYYAKGDTLNTIELLEKAVRISPAPDALNNLGITLRITRQYERSLTYFQQAVEVDSLNPKWHRQLGTAFYYTNNIERAHQAWERAIELSLERLELVDDNDQDMIVIVAELYAKLGQTEQAREYIKRHANYVEENRNDGLSFYSLFQLYEYNGDRQDALIYLDQALQKGFDPVDVSHNPWLQDIQLDPNFQTMLRRNP